jgi:hypothetical protein
MLGHIRFEFDDGTLMVRVTEHRNIEEYGEITQDKCGYAGALAELIEKTCYGCKYRMIADVTRRLIENDGIEPSALHEGLPDVTPEMSKAEMAALNNMIANASDAYYITEKIDAAFDRETARFKAYVQSKDSNETA